MDLGISGRRAIIVGGSEGLGAAIAERLAEAGCDLHLSARRLPALEERAAALKSRHAVAVATTRCNLSDERERAALIAACPDPDILIISGGWPEAAKNPSTLTMAEWRDAMELMMLSAIDLASRVAPGMRARGFGRIVVVTSRLIKEPELELAMPAAARVGLTAYLKALSREVARDGVTVNSLLPGIFLTETQDNNVKMLMAERGHSREQVIRDRASKTPAGRFGEPDEFASLCAYLCSRQAGFLTGQALVIDGGATSGIW